MDDKARKEQAFVKAAYIAKAAALHTLTQYPEWATFQQELDDIERGLIERMLAGDDAQTQYTRGFVMGLRTAQNLSRTMEHHAKNL